MADNNTSPLRDSNSARLFGAKTPARAGREKVGRDCCSCAARRARALPVPVGRRGRIGSCI